MKFAKTGIILFILIALGHSFSNEGNTNATPRSTKSRTGDVLEEKKRPKGNEENTTLEIISAGREPRKILRYKPDINSKQTTKLRVKLNVDTLMDDASSPKNSFPESTIILETTVNKIDRNGDIHYLIKYLDVIAGGTSEFSDTLSKLKNNTFKVLIDSKGNVYANDQANIKVQGKASADLIEKALISGKKVSAQFPAIPVGVGAKWKVKSKSFDEGIATNIIKSYELIRQSGNTASLAVQINEDAPTQEVRSSVINGGMIKLPTKSLSSKETIQMTVNFSKIFPIELKSTKESISKMKIEYPGIPTSNLDIKINTEMNINSFK